MPHKRGRIAGFVFSRLDAPLTAFSGHIGAVFRANGAAFLDVNWKGLMYFVLVILLLLIFPVASVATEAALSRHTLHIIFLMGRWFVFWAVGVRLFTAGARQVIQPQFTAEEIFGIHDSGSFAIVREVGFANLSMGLLGICSVFRVGWTLPAALVGGLYYGLAGIGHIFQKGKNAKEYMAMISDGFVFLVLLVFVLDSLA
jgi:hypothetical protein